MYQYLLVEETLSSPYIGVYHSFGISVSVFSDGKWKQINFVSDVSTDYIFMKNLVQACNEGQLDSTHLMDVILDSIKKIVIQTLKRRHCFIHWRKNNWFSFL